MAAHCDLSHGFIPWALEGKVASSCPGEAQYLLGELTWKQVSLFWDPEVPKGGRAGCAGPREGQVSLAAFGRMRESRPRGGGLCRLRLSDRVMERPCVRDAEEAKALEAGELTAPAAGRPRLGTWLHVA